MSVPTVSFFLRECALGVVGVGIFLTPDSENRRRKEHRTSQGVLPADEPSSSPIEESPPSGVLPSKTRHQWMTPPMLGTSGHTEDTSCMTRAATHSQSCSVMDGMRGCSLAQILMYHYWRLSWWSLSHFRVTLTVWVHSVQWCPRCRTLLLYQCILPLLPTRRRCLDMDPSDAAALLLPPFHQIVPSYVLALGVFGIGFIGVYTSHYEHGVLADFGVHLLFLRQFLTADVISFDGVCGLAVGFSFTTFSLYLYGCSSLAQVNRCRDDGYRDSWRIYSRSQRYSSEQWGNQLLVFRPLRLWNVRGVPHRVASATPRCDAQLRFVMALMASRRSLLLAMFYWQRRRWEQYASDV